MMLAQMDGQECRPKAAAVMLDGRCRACDTVGHLVELGVFVVCLRCFSEFWVPAESAPLP
jgi:hypothetical protein